LSDKTKVPQTLLLADDSVTIQRVIELTFADEDITVVAVSDGDQAIGRIEADPPDIVLVDIGMPGKSGYEVARHVKQSPRLQHIPVLLLAGAFEPVDQAKAMAAGCNGVLAKPFEPQLVIARVRELLGSGPAPAHAAAGPPAQTSVSDVWATAPAGPSGDPLGPAQAAHLDNDFAQLDAAFATRNGAPGEQAQATSTRSPLADGIDWFRTAPDAPQGQPLDAVLPPAAVPQRPETAAASPEPVPTVPVSVAPARAAPEPAAEAGVLPSISDAFAAILAAEQHEPMPASALRWLAPPTPPAAPSANGSPSLGDDAIEDITRLVLERLSDRIVRETVADLVSQLAERLVREEIERIKAALK
jgi:CheY-like chemotaxis protein